MSWAIFGPTGSVNSPLSSSCCHSVLVCLCQGASKGWLFRVLKTVASLGKPFKTSSCQWVGRPPARQKSLEPEGKLASAWRWLSGKESTSQARDLGSNSGSKEAATHSSILAWEILWTKEAGGLQSMRSHGVGHGLATDFHFFFFIDLGTCSLIDFFYLLLALRTVRRTPYWFFPREEYPSCNRIID